MINDIAGVGFTLAKGLISRGHDVTLLAKNNPLYKYPSWVILYDNRLDELFLHRIGLGKYDVIHLHYLTNWASLGLFLRHTRVPVLLHAHGSDTRPRNILVLFAQRIVASMGRVLLFSTPDLKENLTWFNGNTLYCPNPVINFLPVKITGKRVLIFATLNKIKKLERIFPLIARLNLNFDIIALGPDKRYYAKIAPKNLNFIQPILHENLSDFLSRYALVIGRQEGSLGMCELESMSHGLPTLFPFKFDSFYTSNLPMPRLSETTILKHLADSELGRQQQQWVKNNHSLKFVCNDLQGVYMRLVNYHGLKPAALSKGQ